MKHQEHASNVNKTPSSIQGTISSSETRSLNKMTCRPPEDSGISECISETSQSNQSSTSESCSTHISTVNITKESNDSENVLKRTNINVNEVTREERLVAKWRKKAPNADIRLAEMLENYQRYRYSAIALGVCCLALLGCSMALYGNHVITAATQNAMILGSYLFVALMLFLVLARVRPLKKDITSWNSALNATVFPSSKKKKGNDDESVPRQKRQKNPDTPEFKHWRRLWRVCIFIAVAIMFSAMVLIRLDPSDITVAIIVLTSSYIFLALAVYLERRKMKPLRDEWRKIQAKKEKKEKRKYARKASRTS